LRKQEQRAIELCGNDEACKAEMRQVFQELWSDGWGLKLKVIDEDWQDARDAKKALRDRLLGLIPQYPDLREILEDLLRIIDEEEGSISMNATAGSITTIGGPKSQLRRIDYDLAGSVTVDNWLVSGPMDFAGELDVTGMFSTDLNGSTSFAGRVTAGWISIQMPDGSVYDATVYDDQLGGLESALTATEGVGELSLVLAVDRQVLDNNPQWGVLIDSPTVVRLPIEMDQQKNLSLSFGPGEFGDLFPREPWLSSDYNGDGQLEEVTDFAAFTAGWNAQESLADSDFDADWDQDDVSLWWTRFYEDLANE
jgi:hypothetical protein